MTSYTGSSSARQSVGQPGHCDRCAEVGHVVAHPSLGCSDVGCGSTHPEPTAGLADQVVEEDGLHAHLVRLMAPAMGENCTHDQVRAYASRLLNSPTITVALNESADNETGETATNDPASPEDCSCGYGGFHEPENTRCAAHDPTQTLAAHLERDTIATTPAGGTR